MLTEKDYCDYDTCVALKELGYPTKMTFVNEFGSIEIPINSGLIQLYEAQKWLRNTHNLHISTKPYPNEGGLMWMFEIRRFTPYLVCVIKNKTGFREAEEALLEGIKEAIVATPKK